MEEPNSGPNIGVSNVNDQVYRYIKNKLVNGGYQPNEKINIKNIQDELKVSPTPIKSGLARIAGEGLIEVTRKGFFVKHLTKDDIIELFDLRMLIELGVFELIDQINDQDINSIEDTFNKIYQYSDDYTQFMEQDFDFHCAIIGLTKNKTILQNYKKLNTHIKLARFQYNKNLKQRFKIVVAEHGDILQALHTKDINKIKSALKTHIQNTKTYFEEILPN